MNNGDSSKQSAVQEAGGSFFRRSLRRYPLAPGDVALLKRLTIVIALGALFLAAFHHLDLVYGHKFFDVTGRAEWIWAPANSVAAREATREIRRSGVAGAVTRRVRSLGHDLKEIAALVPVRNGHFDGALARQTLRDMFIRDDRPMGSSDNPLAFFATLDFDLPPNRYYTHVKVLGDPEYTIFFNGREIGGRRMGEDSKLDVYDVSPLSRTGRNRVVVAVRSTTATGGLIASIDLSPEVANYVVTGPSWKIVRSWSPDLLLRDPAAVQKPVLLGAPPNGRWNYLEPQDRPLEVPPAIVVEARNAFSFGTALPELRDASGTTIVTRRPERATAYDFGEVDGRLRITRLYNVELPAMVKVRFANIPEELRPIEGLIRSFVFAPGEATVTDTEVQHFRFASVYGRPVQAVVLK